MKDFGAWFRESIERTAAADKRELPDNVVQMQDGSYRAQCCCCEQWGKLFCDISEVDETYEHYCGGSPRCLP